MLKIKKTNTESVFVSMTIHHFDTYKNVYFILSSEFVKVSKVAKIKLIN